MTIIRNVLISITLFVFQCLSSSVNAEDKILSATLKQAEIGIKEQPTLEFDLALTKTRDLHISILDIKTWRPVKRTMRRIKKSGNYHLKVDVDDIQPGNYRVDVYITPKGKDWSARFGDTVSNNLLVLEDDYAPKPSVFSNNDLIRLIEWPKTINHNDEVKIKVLFDITEPRNLHVKLLDSSNWAEFGSMKFPVKESGNIEVPLADIKDNFPAGKYAWVAYLTESNSENKVSKELGKHFTIEK